MDSEASTTEGVSSARYDASLGAWVLTRYADVVAALADSRLAVGEGDDDGAHTLVREAARAALPRDHAAAWRTTLETSARSLIATLPRDDTVDLARDLADPWSLSLALAATSASPHDASHLAGLAREVFVAAAHATSTDVSEPSVAASRALAVAFGGAPAGVQTFVALSQTLPRALSSAWLMLIQHPGETARLRSAPESMPRAVDELLRLTGPSRAVFRQARASVEIGDARILEGDRVVLMLTAANHDGDRFSPDTPLDLLRDSAGHVALGRGVHACAGASVIRTAMSVATRALLAATTGIDLAGEVAWLDGFAIRAVTSVPVLLRTEVARD
ncbi:MAG: cytochrome P450 [Gemmatimonadaceae bacterium]